MYLGPLEQSKPWDLTAIKGMYRFLEKICNIKRSNQKSSQEAYYKFNEMLKKCTSDFQQLKFNTSIAAIIIFINSVEELDDTLYKKLFIILAPLAPHLCEYMFNQISEDKNKSIFNEKWPDVENLEKIDEIAQVVITYNGKKRSVEQFDISVTDSELVQFIENYAKNHNMSYSDIKIIRSSQGGPKLINVIEKK
jgi:leucyl-tRNA synthetase